MSVMIYGTVMCLYRYMQTLAQDVCDASLQHGGEENPAAEVVTTCVAEKILPETTEVLAEGE